MRKSLQITLFSIFTLGTVAIGAVLFLKNWDKIFTEWSQIALWVAFLVTYLLLVNEGVNWIKNGKRGDWSDLIVIVFLFIVVFLWTANIMTSFIGAFSIYLIFGIQELKDYEVLNKILLITVITYNLIFFAGVIDQLLIPDLTPAELELLEGYDPDKYLNIAFSASFWIMLILGFIFFGRKYIVVWRFMSPEYLSLALYMVAWLAISGGSKLIKQFYPDSTFDLMEWIYLALIITNLVVYALTGPLLDLLFGMKKSDNPELVEIINEIAPKMGLDPAKIKIRFGKYPIINAFAYGAFWDKRMGIIAPNQDHIPKDELKGIVAHELAHLKGKHTLSLSFITIGELLVRWRLGWPATYYDYVFDEASQPFPLWAFIVINLVIYFFIFIFVRMFEGRSDLNTKRAGYGKELAKGLYNLESFYAYGREIGLNTMLLCDEKITESNRTLDYLTTANYLDEMIVNPGRLSLISNFMNAHPPSYHRIICVLHDEDFGIGYESIMPILFLSKKIARKFYRKIERTIPKLHELTTDKIKEEFKIKDITAIMEKTQQKELKAHKIGKTYIYSNFNTLKKTVGVLKQIKYVDNACNPSKYLVETSINGSTKLIELNPYQWKETEIDLESKYHLRKFKNEFVLRNVDLESMWNPKRKEKINTKPISEKDLKRTGLFLFDEIDSDSADESQFYRPIYKTKLPKSHDFLLNSTGKDILLKTKGTFQHVKLREIDFSQSLTNFNIVYATSEGDIMHTREEMILSFRNPYMQIHNDAQTKENEKELLQYYSKNQTRVTLMLKKPVNNELDGWIQELKLDEMAAGIQELKFKNIFGEADTVLMEKIDGIYIEQPSIILELKSDVSIITKLMGKIRMRIHPDRIIL